ncbi:MAG: holo-ACP synthase [Fibrobacterota bacterium]
MILGIGTDIINISRMDSLLEKAYAHRFIQKVFTPCEREYCFSKKKPSMHFAGRWAVKEAFYKALPAPLQKISSWHSVELCRQNGTKPQLRLLSVNLQEEFTARGGVRICHSLSHEKEYAFATVLLEDISCT